MEFRILGPVEACRAGQVIPIGAPMQRAVLAAMLLRAGQVVAVDHLVDQLWGARPPRTARVTVRNYVQRLRQHLPNPVVETHPPGYRINVADGAVDLCRFEQLAAAARRASQHESALAAAKLDAALALWRGPPLSDIGTAELRHVEVPRLIELRFAAIEDWARAKLRLGRPTEVLTELTKLCAEEPLRESAHGLLMLALYRAERQADALAAYHAIRTRLVDEVAVDPGPGLQRLHRLVLNADRALLDADPVQLLANSVKPAINAALSTATRPPSPAAPAPRSGPTASPRQLPADVPCFTGRRPHLHHLDALLAGDRTAIVISVIVGAAGIGKTALAVHWAHRVARRFPDGQLYVNLRGFDPSGSAMLPAEALRGLLEALDVPPWRIPTTVQTQAALYRSLLASRRVLIVLDNARDAEQVRPLLPGTPGCLTLVTSRNQLLGLLAAEGAHPLTLNVLPTTDARELLARRLGQHRTAADPDAVDEIITLSARLPLALAIAAARAACRPETPLRAIATELRSASSSLDAFASDDPATDPRAVFSWSYHRLDPQQARLFRLLGLHPGPDISVAAAASLAGSTVARVRPLLAELTRAHLLIEHVAGRFALHDLLRAYAGELARALDGQAERRAAAHRVLDHYLHTAHAADRLLQPSRAPITLTAPEPATIPEQPADHQQALAWFTAEHATLLAALDLAATTGFDAHTWRLAWATATFLYRRGHWHDWAHTARTALAAARRLADPHALANAHDNLALAHSQLANYHDARIHLHHALALHHHTNNHTGQARTHHSLATTWERQGRHTQALRHAQHALHLHQAAGDRIGQAAALNMIGWLHALHGDPQALTTCQQALALFQQLGERRGQAATWDSLGYAHHQLGHHTEALTCYHHALNRYQTLGNRYDQSIVLTHIADTHHATGNTHAAHTAWQQALTILDELDHPDADKVRGKLNQHAENTRCD